MDVSKTLKIKVLRHAFSERMTDPFAQLDSPFPYIAGKARAAAALRESGSRSDPNPTTETKMFIHGDPGSFLTKKKLTAVVEPENDGCFSPCFFQDAMSCCKMFCYSFFQ